MGSDRAGADDRDGDRVVTGADDGDRVATAEPDGDRAETADPDGDRPIAADHDAELEERELPPAVLENVPDWDDEYLDRVSDRLMHTYDLERDVGVDGESFDMYGELRVESSKHLFHPSVQYANHHMREYLYADRRSSVTVADLERLVELGHARADERVEPGDQHRATEFTFVLVVPDIPDDIRSFVANFSDRTLLSYGFHGHYEIHCCVVAPDQEAIVTSDRTEIDSAFALWAPIEQQGGGVLSRVRGLFSR